MIVFIKGTLVEARPLSAVVEANGLGYHVDIPVTTAEQLPSWGQEVKLFTYQVFREDAQSLYGFASPEERDFFRLITEKVSGIGPKIALSILSKLSLPILQQAIADGDVNKLAQCPGIGKKTAARLCVELKDKVAAFASSVPTSTGSSLQATPTNSSVGDAVSALIALGYKLDVADRAVQKAAQAAGPDASGA